MTDRAGLISRRVESRRHHCALEPRDLEEAEGWIGFYRHLFTLVATPAAAQKP